MAMTKEQLMDGLLQQIAEDKVREAFGPQMQAIKDRLKKRFPNQEDRQTATLEILNRLRSASVSYFAEMIDRAVKPEGES